MRRLHVERHYSERMGWLRAAVLGANDGVISTASLIVGVAAAGGDHRAIMIAAIAGVVAGAMSMAAGEYVSVSSQADIERADLEREEKELATNAAAEQDELARIYVERGLENKLAVQVAKQLMAHDALGAHARDELGLTDTHRPRPIQAAIASALSFASGALLPVLIVGLIPLPHVSWVVSLCSLLFLAMLGAIAARAGGASLVTGAVRVSLWGALAMAMTALVGAIFGTAFMF